MLEDSCEFHALIVDSSFAAGWQTCLKHALPKLFDDSIDLTCVWQPVESFTMVLASAALVVKQWKKEGMILQQPMASISWLGRTV